MADSSVPSRRMAARLGTPARNASIAMRASRFMVKRLGRSGWGGDCAGAASMSRVVSWTDRYQWRQRVLALAGVHVRPDSHLQRLVAVQRAAVVAGDQRLIGNRKHEQARQ